MIPILYDYDESAFVSNGIGRLRDCISCIVTEERNGVYECDFEYPTTGVHYDLIQPGRVIGVTHDDTGDVQPFDIVGYEKPIDGIVTFHAVHISYRLSYYTVAGSNINTLSGAFSLFNSSTPENPFDFTSDITRTAYLAAADGNPRTIRELMGGIEGSILDTFGGEFEYDKFFVRLWAARGQRRDFTIRYGINMSEYNEEFDISGIYSSCVPFWTNGESRVIGDQQFSGGVTPSGRDQCVPLDVSDKFENKPTKAQVNSMGADVITGQNPTAPVQNITVSFVRLQDMGATIDFENLLSCKLCDTITVVFPDYFSSNEFKIVKTVWNVLANRYDEMELGELSASLSQALGVTNSLSRTGDSSESIAGSLVVEMYDHAYSAVSSGSSTSYNDTVTKAGYYPVGVVGFRTSNHALLPDRINLDNIQSGSCRINFAARAVAAVSASTAYVWVLWVKE